MTAARAFAPIVPDEIPDEFSVPVTDENWMMFMRRWTQPLPNLLPGMERVAGHEIGSRWIYYAGEPDSVPVACVVERITYSRNFPDRPRHMVSYVRDGRTYLASASLAQLSPISGARVA